MNSKPFVQYLLLYNVKILLIELHWLTAHNVCTQQQSTFCHKSLRSFLTTVWNVVWYCHPYSEGSLSPDCPHSWWNELAKSYPSYLFTFKSLMRTYLF